MKGKMVLVFLVLMVVCLNGCSGSGTSALVGKWVPEEDQGFFPLIIELSKDGTGTITQHAANLTWTNGRLIVMNEYGDEEDTWDYKLSGSTLIIFGIEGEDMKFKKK
jgi:hypothetical protein